MPVSISPAHATCVALLGALALSAPSPVPMSDHGDTPLLQMLGRQDANISDLHVFTRGDKLVLAVSTNPAIPPGQGAYLFPADLEIDIHIDNDSAVAFDDPTANAVFGGRVVDPDRIQQDITLRVTFDNAGEPQVNVAGMRGPGNRDIRVFSGLRDDPFIRGPRIGRNSASIVLEFPLEHALDKQSTILVWAQSEIPEVPSPMIELAGRALRSMFPENVALNHAHPRDHLRRFGLVPDVVIFDTSMPAAFPNGRELADDVVDLVGDPRVLANDFPFPTENDVPFLNDFPYLAPPQ